MHMAICNHQGPPASVGLRPDLFQETDQQGLTVIRRRDDQKFHVLGCRVIVPSMPCWLPPLRASSFLHVPGNMNLNSLS